jgi:hypothetical protein
MTQFPLLRGAISPPTPSLRGESEALDAAILTLALELLSNITYEKKLPS